MMRCQVSPAGGVDGSGTGSPSRPESGPGSSGACTSGITASTGFAFAADLAPDFTDLRADLSGGLVSNSGAKTLIGAAAGGGTISITGRLTPISASGTLHSK